MMYKINNDLAFGIYIETMIDRVKSDSKNTIIQQNIVSIYCAKIWKEIENRGITNQIYDVLLQGSVAKGTDLPSSGSDLDIFIIFKNEIPTDIALDIGMKVLEDHNPRAIQAKTKFAEAKFVSDGLPIEIQIVPTRYLELSEIVTRTTIDGEPIPEIGMERTIHQTKFMKNYLSAKKVEVKILKQFMKDVNVYDSSIKNQGFSGYIAESLVHYLDSFRSVIEFFANFEQGITVGDLVNSKKYGKKFNLADPIDPNRNLIKDTVSDIKIARMVLASRHLIETYESKKPSKSEPIKNIKFSFQSSELEPEKLGSQINSAMNNIVKKLENMGFKIPVEIVNVTNSYWIKNYRTQSNVDKYNRVTFTIGVSNTDTLKKIVKSRIKLDIGLPEKAIKSFKEKNKQFEITENDNELIAMVNNDYHNIELALRSILDDNIEQSGLPEGIKSDICVYGVHIYSPRKLTDHKFENIY